MIASLLFAVWLLGFAWALFGMGEQLRRGPESRLFDYAMILSVSICWPLPMGAMLIDAVFYEDEDL